VVAPGNQALDEALVPLFGAFGVAQDDAIVARWSANPLGMLSRRWMRRLATRGGGGAAGYAAAVGNDEGMPACKASAAGLSTQRLATTSS
jgi:hypothetical protein